MNFEFKYQNELKLEFRFTSVTRYNTTLVSQFFSKFGSIWNKNERDFAPWSQEVLSNQFYQFHFFNLVLSISLIFFSKNHLRHFKTNIKKTCIAKFHTLISSIYPPIFILYGSCNQKIFHIFPNRVRLVDN